MRTINERITSLREVMKKEGIAAYIIPSSDAHLSEYTPEHWQGRTWISGFTGSAGTMLITLSHAALWTDGRYFLQAEEELQGTEIILMRMGLKETPSLEDFLISNLSPESIVSVDGACISSSEAKELSDRLSVKNISLRLNIDLLQPVWADRPEIPKHKIFSQPSTYSGESTADRIKNIRHELHKSGANATVITMLCELAWTFNIRGYDVDYNPVAVGFGYIGENESILFMNEEKIPDSVRAELRNNGVSIQAYEAIDQFVENLPQDIILYIDPRRTTARINNCIPQYCTTIHGVSIPTTLKAIKTPTELEHLRGVMKRDGVALTRFFKWFEEFIGSGGEISEYDLGIKLNAFRAQGDKFYGDSFGTIAGYNGHGAIIHYKAEPSTSYTIKNEGVLLLDSGGQYNDGTTDITRMIALSAPNEQLKKDYTLVLKGHIAIAEAQFPEGTRGGQLDILARKALWDNGLNYAHGTGHGVGFFLNVHEGPQSIRTEINPTTLEVGMITSNEPGLYRPNEYGIRIENLIATEERGTTPFGKFLGFETLTLCYMDSRFIERSLLTDSEIRWYNDYQERVYQTLSPELTEEEATWLRSKTKAI